MDTTAGQRRPALKVLIVEDSEDTATSLAELLAFDGHDIQIALDGPSAITTANTHWPDVVLLDVGMPGCDGYEVAKRIREQCVSRPAPLLIVISGYATDADRLRSEAEGISLHFAKPMDPETLMGLLRVVATKRGHT